MEASHHYSYDSNDKWIQFGNLALKINLPFEQRVTISYRVAVKGTTMTYLQTRLTINGEEEPEFDDLTGKT